MTQRTTIASQSDELYFVLHSLCECVVTGTQQWLLPLPTAAGYYRIYNCPHRIYNCPHSLHAFRDGQSSTGVSYGCCFVFIVASTTCRSCPADGRFLFNSAVVIGADGVLAVSYRKAHLFSTASCLDASPIVPVTYTLPATGLRFGLLICFDIEFRASLEALVDVRCTMMCFSERLLRVCGTLYLFTSAETCCPFAL